MKSLIIFLGVLFSAAFFTGCKEKTIQLGKDISFNCQKNISYGDNTEQNLDLYIPDNNPSEKRDVFIIIHGGGWRGGDKSELTFFTLSLMQKFPDCIFANINYRLASSSRFGIPNQTDDIHTAISYLEQTLQYKPKFILLGNSAGGHLSMLYSYKFDNDRQVKAVVNIVGPADLSDSEFKNYQDYSFVEKHLIDPKIISENTSMNVFASPVYWINQSSSPILSFYGIDDKIIPLSQKKILDSVLNKNKVIHKSFEFKGGHLDWYKEPNSAFLINRISEFLQAIDKQSTL